MGKWFHVRGQTNDASSASFWSQSGPWHAPRPGMRQRETAKHHW